MDAPAGPVEEAAHAQAFASEFARAEFGVLAVEDRVAAPEAGGTGGVDERPQVVGVDDMRRDRAELFPQCPHPTPREAGGLIERDDKFRVRHPPGELAPRAQAAHVELEPVPRQGAGDIGHAVLHPAGLEGIDPRGRL